MTELRNQYFPEKRNYLKAHLTLFHKLSYEIGREILGEPGFTTDFNVDFERPYSLGLGVAIEAKCEELARFKAHKIKEYSAHLSPQDQNKGRLHITIQNKVSVPRARETLQEVEGLWKPFSGRVIGLELWEYLGGPWRLEDSITFGK